MLSKAVSDQFIVFDQYQRYHFIQRVVEIVSGGGNPLRILEVGGAFSPLRDLLSGHRVVIVDKVPNVPVLDLRINGLHLPFADRAFGMVVSTDVLEHMKPEEREPFLRELQRVTSDVIIVGFPHRTVLAEQADKAFFELIRGFTGTEFDYLKEHLEHSLPAAEDIRKFMEPLAAEIFEFSNANLYSWLLLQIGNFVLQSHPEFDQARVLMNEFFSRYYEPISHRPPSYRTFFVCFKRNPSASIRSELNRMRKVPAPVSGDAAYAEAAFALALSFQEAMKQAKDVMQKTLQQKDSELAHIQTKLEHVQADLRASMSHALELEADNKKLERDIAQLYQMVDQKQAQIKDQQSRILDLAARAENLQEYLNLFLHHPAYRVYRFFKQQFQKILPQRGAPVTVANSDYELFQRTFEPDKEERKRQATGWRSWSNQPLLSIVTAVFSPPLHVFQETIQSVLGQTYGNWLWNIVDASTDETIWRLLSDLATRDPRVRPFRLAENKGISANTNVALRQATGDYIVMLDHDDTLAPHALYAVARTIREHPDADFIYSDADKLDESGRRCEPLFKPDWSPEMMLCSNLVNQISVFRRNWLDQVGYLNPDLDGAQDWDLYLRITERTNHVYHIPQVLYHWRKTPHSTAQATANKPYVKKVQVAAITNHLQRVGISDPRVDFDITHPIHRVYPVSRWRVREKRLVSLIIPTRDRVEFLERCLKSLFELTIYSPFDVILVDTGSQEQRTWDFYRQYDSETRFKLLRYHDAFNFSKACNFGARSAEGDLLLFLNNDTEILQAEWLDSMVQWFDLKRVGIVGCKLLYPGRKIQHAGVIVGLGGLAAHLFLNEIENISTIFGSDSWYRNLLAVTGACLLISRDVFNALDGFDEGFALNYSDVDLCLRTVQAGYRVVYTPQVRLIHHESVTHGRRIPRSDFERASKKWEQWLKNGDPFFNPNLSCGSCMPQLRQRETDSAYQVNLNLMACLPKKEFILLPDDLRAPRS